MAKKNYHPIPESVQVRGRRGAYDDHPASLLTNYVNIVNADAVDGKFYVALFMTYHLNANHETYLVVDDDAD